MQHLVDLWSLTHARQSKSWPLLTVKIPEIWKLHKRGHIFSMFFLFFSLSHVTFYHGVMCENGCQNRLVLCDACHAAGFEQAILLTCCLKRQANRSSLQSVYTGGIEAVSTRVLCVQILNQVRGFMQQWKDLTATFLTSCEMQECIGNTLIWQFCCFGVLLSNCVL